MSNNKENQEFLFNYDECPYCKSTAISAYGLDRDGSVFNNSNVLIGSGPRAKQSPKQMIWSIFSRSLIIEIECFNESTLECTSVIIAKVLESIISQYPVYARH